MLTSLLIQIPFVIDPLEQFEIYYYCFTSNTYCLLLLVNCAVIYFLFAQVQRKNIFSFFVINVFLFIRTLHENVFGTKNQGFFFTFFFTFVFLLVNNLVGLLPYTYTLTSFLVLPAFLSFTFFGANIYLGFELKGLAFLNMFYPGGAPRPILHFLLIVELISYFMRLISLAVRLFANMVAGHALLKILLSFVWAAIMSASIVTFFGLFAWVIVIGITILEILIAFLQAYVFVFLSMIYLHEIVS